MVVGSGCWLFVQGASHILPGAWCMEKHGCYRTLVEKCEAKGNRLNLEFMKQIAAPPTKKTVRPWKWMVGRRFSCLLGNPYFSGAFAVSPEVQQAKLRKFVENEISISFFGPTFGLCCCESFGGFVKFILPGSLTASKSPWKVIFNTRKGLSSNHHFSAAFAVKLQEGVLCCSESFGFLALNNLKQRLVLKLLGRNSHWNNHFQTDSCHFRIFQIKLWCAVLSHE